MVLILAQERLRISFTESGVELATNPNSEHCTNKTGKSRSFSSEIITLYAILHGGLDALISSITQSTPAPQRRGSRYQQSPQVTIIYHTTTLRQQPPPPAPSLSQSRSSSVTLSAFLMLRRSRGASSRMQQNRALS